MCGDRGCDERRDEERNVADHFRSPFRLRAMQRA
jgi:hypothetical protein